VCAASQESMHTTWNAWRQTVSRRTASNSDRQTAHSGAEDAASSNRTVGNAARTAGSSPAALRGASSTAASSEDGEEAEQEHKEDEHREQLRERRAGRRIRPRGRRAAVAVAGMVEEEEAARGRGTRRVHRRMGRDDLFRLSRRVWLMSIGAWGRSCWKVVGCWTDDAVGACIGGWSGALGFTAR
jgi:hypothetical protein